MNSDPKIDDARHVREQLESANARLQFLNDAGQLFASSLDFDETMASLGRLIVPTLADWYGIELPDAHGILNTVAAIHVDPAKIDQAFEFRRTYPSHPDEPYGVYEVFRTGEPLLIPEMTDADYARGARDARHYEQLRQFGFRSVVIVPLKARDRIIGVMNLCHAESNRRFSLDDVRLIQDVACRAAVALDHARLYAEQVDAKRQAELANQAKTTFLANMSHEIRTPLGAMVGFAELTLDPETSREERQRYAETVVRNGQILTRIIDDILDLSRVEAGCLRVEASDVDLHALVDDVTAIFASTSRRKGVPIKIQFSRDVPAIVRLDAIRLKQILTNVVGNALKFTAKGSVLMCIETCTLNDGAGLKFVVRDTGIGISADKHYKLFSPFSQADDSLSRQYGGTGLGLALSRRLAQAMGGDIVLVESDYGQGSTFAVTVADERVKATQAAQSMPAGTYARSGD